MVKKKEEQTTGKNIGKNMCKIEQKLQRKHLIALSFFLPLLVMTGCCIVFGVQPFGDNSLLTGFTSICRFTLCCMIN